METLSHGDTPFEREGEPRGNEPGIGDIIGRYQLGRQLGQGGMGIVYLARDLTLGRSVALKLVRRERVGEAGLSSFLDEARVIASLNHPHIVQLYDVGEHRDAPYLALEYVDGESLKERCDREALSRDESLRTLRALADALVHAHAAGIVHCDLKPGNIMLARDGRLRVVDFGLAHTATSLADGVYGTPDWMAPEQWLRERATDRVDIWALAVIAVGLLTGGHPFGDDTLRRREQVLAVDRAPRRSDGAGLPEPLADLIARSLERDPQARPSAADWYRTLDEVLDGRGELALEDGPYRGLASFGERHARYFFGRQFEIDAFVERLRTTSLLPVVGPSGVGKSSFVFAGVIPRLRARERWTILALRPGTDPFDSLARHILEAGAGGAASGPVPRRALADELRSTPTLLAARLATVAGATGTQILVVVDQLEELFTQGASERDAHGFLRLLVMAAEDPLEPVRVVFTVRDDFLGHLTDLRSLFVLKRLDAGELRHTITAPLERFGYRLDEPSLGDEMLAELGDDPATELPLLQFACRALWDARDTERRVLTSASYQRIGGVAGALARHADGVLADLSPAELRAARQILIGLVVGTTRKPVERERLLASAPPEDQSAQRRVLDRLISSRLVVQRIAQGSETAMVEIAHESLLRTWKQFARWLDESRDERRLLSELEEATSFWHRRGRREVETWSVEELAAAHHRIAQLGLALPAPVEEFLAAGNERHRRARQRSRIRWTLIGAACIAVTSISVYLAIEFRRQKLAAENAAANFGRFDLSLQPYDWVDGARHPVDVQDVPALGWELHERAAETEHEPGRRIERVLVEHLAAHGAELLDRVDVRGGMAFLRIDGRGRRGESCAPSWIRLQALPGYADRSGPLHTFEIPVPTCQASRAGTVLVPGGAFIYGGPGEPPTRFLGYVEPEVVVDLESYRIDRTEVSNARFAAFAQLSAHSGYPSPKYPAGGLGHSGDPSAPVTSIDAFEAEAFCRNMGQRLPSDYEWTKVARGGLTLDGKLNPSPRRLFPWGVTPDIRCANVDGIADGHDWVAPVDALGCGASPYGALQLVGNVSEWISGRGQSQATPLREVRGGDVESPPELEQATTVFRNAREARQFTFSIGIRCAGDGPREQLKWNGQ